MNRYFLTLAPLSSWPWLVRNLLCVLLEIDLLIRLVFSMWKCPLQRTAIAIVVSQEKRLQGIQRNMRRKRTQLTSFVGTFLPSDLETNKAYTCALLNKLQNYSFRHCLTQNTWISDNTWKHKTRAHIICRCQVLVHVLATSTMRLYRVIVGRRLTAACQASNNKLGTNNKAPIHTNKWSLFVKQTKLNPDA